MESINHDSQYSGTIKRRIFLEQGQGQGSTTPHKQKQIKREIEEVFHDRYLIYTYCVKCVFIPLTHGCKMWKLECNKVRQITSRTRKTNSRINAIISLRYEAIHVAKYIAQNLHKHIQ